MMNRSVGSLETWEPPDKSFSKHTLTVGTGDITPNEGSVCMVHISFVDEIDVGEEALGNYKLNELFELTVGEGDTVLSEHFDKVICSMKEGESCYVKSKIDLAGNKVSDFDAKKKAMKFNVLLKSFTRQADWDELESDEKLEQIQLHKDKATEIYQAGNIDFAIKRYEKCEGRLAGMRENISTLPEDMQSQHRLLRLQCYLNLAAAYLKKEKYENVVSNCSNALEIEKDSVKGLFRRAQAFTKLHKYDEARHDLQAAHKLEPQNKAVSNQLVTVETLMKKEKQMYQKMFEK